MWLNALLKSAQIGLNVLEQKQNQKQKKIAVCGVLPLG
jgi:hypothetical protein